jgi:transcriptional regulator with XRE-family HTH domain
MAKESIQLTIGKFIKRERKKQNMTLQKLSLLAFKNEMNSHRISKIEQGLTKSYSIETLDRILKALGFSFAEMFRD